MLPAASMAVDPACLVVAVAALLAAAWAAESATIVLTFLLTTAPAVFSTASMAATLVATGRVASTTVATTRGEAGASTGKARRIASVAAAHRNLFRIEITASCACGEPDNGLFFEVIVSELFSVKFRSFVFGVFIGFQ